MTWCRLTFWVSELVKWPSAMSDYLLWFSRLVLSGLAVVLGTHLTAHQGQEPSVQKPVPAIKAEVNEVLVPVVVTDAQGQC